MPKASSYTRLRSSRRTLAPTCRSTIDKPVVLERDTWDRWLDPEVTDSEELKPLLVPTVAGTLIHHPVGKAIGNVRNDGPELVEAIALDGDPGLNSL